MHVVIVTLFPEMIDAVFRYGVSGRAVERGILKLHCINPRDFTVDRHQTVDDRPYGGGPGMVMLAEPLSKAVSAAQDWLVGACGSKGSVVFMSPQGEAFTQQKASAVVEQCEALVLVSGRYEGVDERFIDQCVDEEWSIGDYVLSGGELPAMVAVDALTRLLPGALGDSQSAEEDSFVAGLLDCPHYTRPPEFDGLPVPDVLLSGDHGKIKQWRMQQALGRTKQRRPDLLERLQLSESQQALLEAYFKGS